MSLSNVLHNLAGQIRNCFNSSLHFELCLPQTHLSQVPETHFVELNQKDGEKELIELARTTCKREDWVYTKHNSCWYHLPIEHEEYPGRNNIDEVLRGQELIEYLVHGMHFVDSVSRAVYKEVDIQKQVQEKQNKVVVDAIEYYLAFPTVQEMYHFAHDKTAHSSLNWSWAVVAPLGITRIDIKDLFNTILSVYEKESLGLPSACAKLAIRAPPSAPKKEVLQKFITCLNKTFNGKILFDFTPRETYF